MSRSPSWARAAAPCLPRRPRIREVGENGFGHTFGSPGTSQLFADFLKALTDLNASDRIAQDGFHLVLDFGRRKIGLEQLWDEPSTCDQINQRNMGNTHEAS